MRSWKRNLPSLFAIAGILLACLSVTYAVWQATAAIHQINVERARNTQLACQSQNRQNAVLVGFIEQSIPKDRRKDPRVLAYIARAKKTWPQSDCRQVVKDRVSS